MVGQGELSSITSTLEELAARITAAAEEENGAGHDGMASELFAVERALLEAVRRLRRLV